MQDLKDRTRNFSLRIMKLYDAIPRRASRSVIAGQLIRSGLSVGSHYREAIRGRSAVEYSAKLNEGLMELEETLYWMELLDEGGIVPHRRLADLLDEASQLTAIFVTLIKKAKQ